MKPIFFLILLFSTSIYADNPKHDKAAWKTLSLLKQTAKSGKVMFGHQDDLMYGQSWTLSKDDHDYKKSDIFSICGFYPAVLGLDIGRIELGGERNLDGNLFSQIREAAIVHYNRGGILTFSWHTDNPITGGTAWDVSCNNVVGSILHDPVYNHKFLGWLDLCAEFFKSLKSKNGKLIPIIFRPYHEYNTNGFWWGGSTCTDEEYIELWKLTYTYLVKNHKLTNLIWTYSPYNVQDKVVLLRRYPGDNFVDIIGYELYQIGAVTMQAGVNRFVDDSRKGLTITEEIAREHNKLVAFCEVGMPGVQYPNWWTECLYRSIHNRNFAYVLTWRNGYKSEDYCGPCEKSASVSDFKEFSKKDICVFLIQKR